MKKSLTAVEAKSINTPGAYRAGETLYLNVAPGGSKSWVQRLTVHGRRCDIGLGGFPLVSLAEAREAAFQNRKLARTGGDPLAEKHKARVTCPLKARPVIKLENNLNWTTKEVNHGKKKLQTRRDHQTSTRS